ncbi:MAG: NAD-dependent epimerase/dehydratase family protein [Flavobacteriales bacterium]|nr:NAD-dependent epimerase/dehydratase family protein [Flavobacteriales bacterium]
MRIAITGAGGFIGGSVLARLMQVGLAHERAHVAAIASSEASMHRIRALHPEVDCGRFQDSEALLRGCQVLLHAGWSTVPATAETDPLGDLRDNVEGSINVFEQAARMGVRRIVFLSSGGTVYGAPIRLPIDEAHPLRPQGAYGASKLCVERYLAVRAKHHGIEHVILRPSNVYGRSAAHDRPQGVVEHWLKAALVGVPVEPWADLRLTRDYLHIDDLVDALVAALHLPIKHNVLNVGTGRGTELSRMAEMVSSATGRQFKVSSVRPQHRFVMANVLDGSRIAECWGIIPRVSLEQGLARTWAAMNGEDRKDSGE